MLHFENSYAALEQLELSIDYHDANESYGFIRRLFDVFSRLISNVKTQLVSINKKFKRSELRFYHDSKKRGIQNLYNKKYFDKTLMVPIPSGMKVTYNTAVDKINDLFKQLNIEDTADILLLHLKEDAFASPDDITKKISKLTKTELEKELQTVFSLKKTLDVPLRDVIDNFQQLLEVDKKLLLVEAIFKNVSNVCDKLGLIEHAVDKIVTELENKKEFDRAYVKKLHILIKTTAFQFDAFGVLLAEISRVEHNFVLLLEKLVTVAAKD